LCVSNTLPASIIGYANHRIMRAAVESYVVHCVADRVWFAVQQATEWQHIGNQVDAATIPARADFVNVHIIFCETPPQSSQ
jgi:hypothetical protein